MLDLSKSILTCILSIISFTGTSQSNKELLYETENRPSIFSSYINSNNEIILGGHASTSPGSSAKFSRVDTAGNLLSGLYVPNALERTYYDVIKSSTGDLLCTGTAQDSWQDPAFITISCYDEFGGYKWSRRSQQFEETSRGTSIFEDPEGNIVVTGYFTNNNDEVLKPFFTKLDSAGNILSNFRFDTDISFEVEHTVVIDDHIYINGIAKIGAPLWSPFIIKTDWDGNVLESKVVVMPDANSIGFVRTDIAVLPDGEMVVFGLEHLTFLNFYPTYLKFNSDLDPIAFQRTEGPGDFSLGTTLTSYKTGHVQSFDFDDGIEQYAVFQCFDDNHELNWSRIVISDGCRQSIEAMVTLGDDIMAFGTCFAYDFSYQNFGFFKYNPQEDASCSISSLTSLYQTEHDFSFTDYPFETTEFVDFNNYTLNYTLAPASYTLTPSDHCAEGPVSVVEPDGGPVGFYPNPAEQVIRYQSSYEGFSEVMVFDMHGKLVFSNSQLSNGEELDVRPLLPGPYVFMVKKHQETHRQVVFVQ